ncbi:hypothetical protein LPJ72_005255, partial [Coemansia sp. Benny D160-2]
MIAKYGTFALLALAVLGKDSLNHAANSDGSFAPVSAEVVVVAAVESVPPSIRNRAGFVRRLADGDSYPTVAESTEYSTSESSAESSSEEIIESSSEEV